MWPSWVFTKNTGSQHITETLPTNVHCRYSQPLCDEPIQVSINRRMDKKAFSAQRTSHVICRKMDATREHHIKQIKSQRKALHVFLFSWVLDQDKCIRSCTYRWKESRSRTVLGPEELMRRGGSEAWGHAHSTICTCKCLTWSSTQLKTAV